MRRRLLLSYVSLVVFVLLALELPLGLSFANAERRRLTTRSLSVVERSWYSRYFFETFWIETALADTDYSSSASRHSRRLKIDHPTIRVDDIFRLSLSHLGARDEEYRTIAEVRNLLHAMAD